MATNSTSINQKTRNEREVEKLERLIKKYCPKKHRCESLDVRLTYAFLALSEQHDQLNELYQSELRAQTETKL